MALQFLVQEFVRRKGKMYFFFNIIFIFFLYTKYEEGTLGKCVPINLVIFKLYMYFNSKEKKSQDHKEIELPFIL